MITIPFPVNPATLAGPVAGAVAVMAWRLREAQRPLTPARIIMPPLGMATGFSMFIVPAFRVPLTWAVAALALGALVFAWPVLLTTRLYRDGRAIMMRRSPAFILVLVALVIVRLALRGYVAELVSAKQTAALFYLLAFGMIARWRATMWVSFRRIASEPRAA